MNYWFTADLHFDHANVIKYAKRPFLAPDGSPDVELMNEELVRRHNALVAQKDYVFYLGDLSLGSPKRAFEHIRRLNGIKHWVPGNHDKELLKNGQIFSLFEWVRELTEIRVPDDTVFGRTRGVQAIVLCHYAMRVWNKSHYGAWQLFGHSHGSLKDELHLRQLDVGVDNWSYAPVSYQELKQKMAEKVWKPIDHHGAPRDI